MGFLRLGSFGDISCIACAVIELLLSQSAQIERVCSSLMRMWSYCQH
jgi:hypothetical protein